MAVDKELYSLQIADLADLADIYAFELANLPDAWSLKSLEQALESKYETIVLLKNRVTNAIVALLHWQLSNDSINIYNFAVAAAYRRQGLARQLLRLLEACAKDKQAETAAICKQLQCTATAAFAARAAQLSANKQILLEVRESNSAALQTYLASGFTCIHKIPYFYKTAAYGKKSSLLEQGEAALLMQKELS